MTDVATWSQLLSSIAVIGTLIYLAVEIRQNTAAEHAATRLGINNASTENLYKVVDHPEIFVWFAQDDPLTPEQSSRLHSWLCAHVREIEYSWQQYENRLIEGYYWEGEKAVIQAVLGYPRTRSWWLEIGRQIFGPDFVDEVDRLVKDQPYSTLIPKMLAWGARKMAA